jgi:hypothetical protein
MGATALLALARGTAVAVAEGAAVAGAEEGATVGVTGVSDVGVTTPAALPAATWGVGEDAVAKETPTTAPVAVHITSAAGRRIRVTT